MTDPTALPAFTVTDPSGTDPSGDDGPGADPRRMRTRVVESLSAEGFRPEIDPDGDVLVKVAGQPMFVRSFDTQPAMLRVWSQWGIDEAVPGDELTRLRAANAMSAVLNLVKVTLLDDRLVVAVDLTVNDAMNLDTLLTATLEAVRDGVTTWHGTVIQMLEEQGRI